MMPRRAHSYWVMGCWPLAAAYSPPPCGEGLGVGVFRPAAPPPRSPSASDPPRKGEGEEEVIARHGFGVLGKLRARYFPVTLPLSTGLIGRPSYSSTPPRSFTHSMRWRLRPFSTSIAMLSSVYGPVVS